ncbi:MAG: polysaccharide deacetylase family protein [Prevotellaceae bacterium]|jgi:peptidoglycan/xylan/chitin deacetylase (PgdA/CDA1 family)|nr:polysaccharide deacetylase family protein [Prevotellaceae bacterium]
MVSYTYYLLKHLYKGVWFRRQEECEKIVHLTFDDGPIPEVTNWVLDVLRQYNIKATFFCIGDNVRKYPDVYAQILAEGHSVGNHTFGHLRGFWTKSKTYVENVEKAARYIDSKLFRPPHGIMRMVQKKALEKKYQIVMSDTISCDYDRDLAPETVLHNVKKHVKNGSIIVFHDSLKAEPNLRYALPKAIEFLLAEGYEFRKL